MSATLDPPQEIAVPILPPASAPKALVSFRCDARDFAAKAQAAAKIINSRTQTAVLSCLEIIAEVGRVRVRSTNLETTVDHAFPAEVTECGTIAVPSEGLDRYLATLADTIITVKGEANGVTIRGDKSVGTFAISTDLLPPLSTGGEGTPIAIVPREAFVRAIASIAFAASTETTRGAIFGINLKLDDSTLTLTATDGYRLARSTVTLDRKAAPLDVTVPSQALTEIGRISDTPLIVRRFGTSPDHLSFTSGSDSIATRLLSGTYPNVERILGDPVTTRVRVSRDALVAAVRRCAIVAAKDKSSRITMHVDPLTSHLELVRSDGFQGTTALEKIDADIEGTDTVLSVQAMMLNDMLARLRATTVSLEFHGPGKPIRLTTPDDPSTFMLLMPLAEIAS